MKLRIAKTDHARIQRTCAALGIDTTAVVRRCIIHYKRLRPGVATTAKGDNATTVITLSDRAMRGFSADQVRAAVGFSMDMLDTALAARSPVEVDGAGNFVRVIA
jgi:hypothetical protein